MPAAVMNSIGIELIEIPVWAFTMGSPYGEYDREPNEEQANVRLTKPFFLGTTEVTQGQFNKVMGTEPWVGQDCVQIGEDNAASYVNWHDATAFCQKLTDLECRAGKLPADESYRLPTEAEWEYACRAGTTTVYSVGDGKKRMRHYAWFDRTAIDAGERYAHKVGLKKPNPWGLYDMHGNVREWCSDWYDYDNALPGGTDPVGPRQGSHRVYRGGDWGSDPEDCRSASRCYCYPSDRNDDTGFRVARSLSANQYYVSDWLNYLFGM